MHRKITFNLSRWSNIRWLKSKLRENVRAVKVFNVEAFLIIFNAVENKGA